MKIRDILKDEMTEVELSHLVTSYDIVGDIVIIDIPEEILHKKGEIANAILKVHKNVKNVCMRGGSREGEFRLRKTELIAGTTTVTEHRENGCRFQFDVIKVYYSPRESTERLRIAEMLKPNETIMVLFAGIGPYAIVLGKKRSDIKKIYALEINPDAVESMKDNIRINKLQMKVVPILGDANEDCKSYYRKCDRVIMPLPKSAHEFLYEAFMLLKKEGGIVHLYFVDEDNILEEKIKPALENTSTKTGFSFEIMAMRKVLPYGPGTYKKCLDVKAYAPLDAR